MDDATEVDSLNESSVINEKQATVKSIRKQFEKQKETPQQHQYQQNMNGMVRDNKFSIIIIEYMYIMSTYFPPNLTNYYTKSFYSLTDTRFLIQIVHHHQLQFMENTKQQTRNMLPKNIRILAVRMQTWHSFFAFFLRSSYV